MSVESPPLGKNGKELLAKELSPPHGPLPASCRVSPKPGLFPFSPAPRTSRNPGTWSAPGVATVLLLPGSRGPQRKGFAEGAWQREGAGFWGAWRGAVLAAPGGLQHSPQSFRLFGQDNLVNRWEKVKGWAGGPAPSRAPVHALLPPARGRWERGPALAAASATRGSQSPPLPALRGGARGAGVAAAVSYPVPARKC